MKFSSDPAVGNKDSFLQIKSGESAIGVFRGEPHEFFVRWEQNGNKRTAIPCHHTDEGAKFRFRVEFITKVNGAYVSKTWEQGAQVYKSLKVINADFPLEETIIKITRHGDGMDTEYSVFPNGQNFKVNQPLAELLAQVQPIDVRAGTELQHPNGKPVEESGSPDFGPPGPGDMAQEIPF